MPVPKKQEKWYFVIIYSFGNDNVLQYRFIGLVVLIPFNQSTPDQNQSQKTDIPFYTGTEIHVLINA